MKTICRSLLCLLISLSVIVSCTSTLYAYDSDIEDAAEASMRKDVPGEVAFHKFNDIVARDAEKSAPQYSDFLSKYAGSSIDDSGKLTVYLAGECENRELLIEELCSVDVTSESICFVTVKYSYAELKSFQNAMWAFRNETAADKSDELLCEWANKIQSVAVSPKSNAVVIIAKDFSGSDYDYCEKFFGEYSYEIEITDREFKITEAKGEE